MSDDQETRRRRRAYAALHAAPWHSGEGPAWAECMCCAYVCTEHSADDEPVHVGDCACPEYAEWLAIGLDPYRTAHPGDEAFA